MSVKFQNGRLQISDIYELIQEAVKKTAESICHLSLRSGCVFISFYHYEKATEGSKDRFYRMDIIDENPLFDIQNGLGKEKGGFYYEHQAVDSRSYVVGRNVLAENSPWPKELKSIAKKNKIYSLVAVPVEILGKDHPIGVIVIYFESPLQEGSLEEERILAICNLLAFGIKNEIENIQLREEQVIQKVYAQERARAKEIQRELLPKGSCIIEDYDIAGKLIPCEDVSGDFYDYFLWGDNRLICIISDAIGHGYPAALLNVQLYPLIRAFVQYNLDLVQVAEKINETLCQTMPESMFVTGFLGLLDIEKHKLTYVSAGQGNILHFRWQQKKIYTLAVNGPMLGVEPDLRFDKAIDINMEQGDMLVLLTDGFWERRKGGDDHISPRRIRRVIKENWDRKSEVIINKLIDSVANYARGTKLDDDQTALIIKRELK